MQEVGGTLGPLSASLLPACVSEETQSLGLPALSPWGAHGHSQNMSWGSSCSFRVSVSSSQEGPLSRAGQHMELSGPWAVRRRLGPTWLNAAPGGIGLSHLPKGLHDLQLCAPETW